MIVVSDDYYLVYSVIEMIVVSDDYYLVDSVIEMIVVSDDYYLVDSVGCYNIIRADKSRLYPVFCNITCI